MNTLSNHIFSQKGEPSISDIIGVEVDYWWVTDNLTESVGQTVDIIPEELNDVYLSFATSGLPKGVVGTGLNGNNKLYIDRGVYESELRLQNQVIQDEVVFWQFIDNSSSNAATLASLSDFFWFEGVSPSGTTPPSIPNDQQPHMLGRFTKNNTTDVYNRMKAGTVNNIINTTAVDRTAPFLVIVKLTSTNQSISINGGAYTTITRAGGTVDFWKFILGYAINRSGSWYLPSIMDWYQSGVIRDVDNFGATEFSNLVAYIEEKYNVTL